MSKKIVAIGGGRIKNNESKTLYETEPMDREIIKLTGKTTPNFLFISHSQPLERQQEYFETIQNIYNKKYNCPCKDLKSNQLNDKNKVKKIIEWADIIYEAGGNTLDMIKLWKKTSFDIILKEAWQKGKVLCGVSAGANCWFKECSSDSLRILYGNKEPLIDIECLGLVNGFFVPHCDEPGRYDSAKEFLKEKELVGLLISNCAALEIIDNKYRLITSDASNHGIKPYGLKCYWKNGQYYQETIPLSNDFKDLNNLLSKH